MSTQTPEQPKEEPRVGPDRSALGQTIRHWLELWDVADAMAPEPSLWGSLLLLVPAAAGIFWAAQGWMAAGLSEIALLGHIVAGVIAAILMREQLSLYPTTLMLPLAASGALVGLLRVAVEQAGMAPVRSAVWTLAVSLLLWLATPLFYRVLVFFLDPIRSSISSRWTAALARRLRSEGNREDAALARVVGSDGEDILFRLEGPGGGRELAGARSLVHAPATAETDRWLVVLQSMKLGTEPVAATGAGYRDKPERARIVEAKVRWLGRDEWAFKHCSYSEEIAQGSVLLALCYGLAIGASWGISRLVSAPAPVATAPAPAPRADGTAEGPRIRVVGSVQDGGLPHAACTCTRCEAARRDLARRRLVAGLALVLPDKRQVYLVDATPDIRQQLDALAGIRNAPAGRVDRAPLSGVLLTHAHIGHYTGLSFFGFEAVSTQKLPVLCSPRMAGFLRNNGPWGQLVRLNNISLNELEPERPFPLGEGVTVASFAVPHRDEYSDTLGFLFRGPRSSLLYVPDTDSWARWSRALPEVLAGVDVALLDGTFYSLNELPGRDVTQIGHPLMTTTMDLLEPLVRSGKTRVFFTHLNHSNPTLDPASEERAEMERRGFHVVDEGQEFPL